MKLPSISPLNIAIFIALLFHVSGAIGIISSPYKNWFIDNTPLNLVIMCGLLIWLHPEKNAHFWLFFIATFLVGMGVEMVGVHTGKLFGSYHYGKPMGKQLNGVPYIIGINWFVVVYSCGMLQQKINNWIVSKYEERNIRVNPWLQTLSFVFDAAMITTLFDYYLEPIAIKLKFWYWKDDVVPDFNFYCWFGISALLLLLFRKMDFKANNQFAVHLLVIQLLFFIALQNYI